MTIETDRSRVRSLQVINALRQGSNLLDGVGLFSAGREPILRAADELLDELTLCDMSAVRWLKGGYGSGKTHTFARIRELATAKNWVTSYVMVTGRGQGCELHRFHEVYSSIVMNCSLPDVAAGGKSQSGWATIMADWVDGLKRQAGAKPGGDIPFFKVADVLNNTIIGLTRNHGIHGSYAAALAAYATALLDNDSEGASLLLEWFAGKDVLKQSSEVKKALRERGILESVSQKNAKAMLRQMTAFLRYRGFSGLLVLFDEVENVLQLTPSSRRAAYTIVRELIDNADSVNGMTRTLLYFSGTPDLFDAETGVKEYEALASRILAARNGGPPNPAAAVLELEDFPFTREDLVKVAGKIAQVYATAYPNRNPLNAKQLTDGRFEKPPYPTARTWVKFIVDELDRVTV
jgi:hypothetical protein